MKSYVKPLLAGLLIFTIGMLCLSNNAHAEFFKWDEGMWRVELAVSGGIHSGTKSRSGDVLYTSFIEYEVPVLPRATLGLRLLPMFIYDSPTNVWGGGVGLSARFYEHKDIYEGLYVETWGHAIYHEHRISGNSSNFNFLIGAGLGYQFPNNWHAIIRYDHISNAGIGNRNAGVNAIGLGIGYRF